MKASSSRLRAAGGSAVLSADGTFKKKPDVAIVVFGESPYAEFMGDRDTLAFEPGDPRDLRLIRALKAQGIPVVAVFLSGRPMYATREINASDAFVAAWLPGTEGGGHRRPAVPRPRRRPAIRFPRPSVFLLAARAGTRLRSTCRGPGASDADRQAYNPLFAFDYGLDYAPSARSRVLPEAPGGRRGRGKHRRLSRRRSCRAAWSMAIIAGDGSPSPVPRLPASTPALTLASADHLKQEDTLVATWTGSGGAGLAVSGAPIDLSRQTNGDMALRLDLRVDTAPTGSVLLQAGCGAACRGTFDLAASCARSRGRAGPPSQSGSPAYASQERTWPRSRSRSC